MCGQNDECIRIVVVTDCGFLPVPSNGFVFHPFGTLQGERAEYICNIGFNLIGPSIRVCQENGSWSEMEPTCQGI